MAVFNAAIPF